MKTKQILTTIGVLVTLLNASINQAATITAAGSGQWDSTTPNAPWPGGTPPTSSDDVVIGAGFTVTVVAPAAANTLAVNDSGVCQNNNTLTVAGDVFGTGSVIQGANATLNVGGGTATYGNGAIATLSTTASGNTVNYTGNAFFAKRQSYFNLTLSGGGNFYTGNVGITGDNAAGPITIAGNLTMSGPNVQLANDMTISGNLTIGTGSTFDPSCSTFSVAGGTRVTGILTDGCGGGGLTDILQDVTILPGGTWAMSDVTQWSVSGSLTNMGTMSGANYAGITFVGTGRLAGASGISMQAMVVNGTYEVATPITVSTNLVLNGTLIVDVKNTAPANTLTYNNGTLFYGGNLAVTNVGPALVSGNSFQLFNASSYGGSFASTTYPALGSGLSWTDNLATSGTIAVTGTGTGGGSPTLTITRSGGNVILSWDTSTFPGYSLQSSTGLGQTWGPVSGGNVSPFTTPIVPANRTVFYRLHNP
jgi:hypothetical protein